LAHERSRFLRHSRQFRQIGHARGKSSGDLELPSLIPEEDGITAEGAAAAGGTSDDHVTAQHHQRSWSAKAAQEEEAKGTVAPFGSAAGSGM